MKPRNIILLMMLSAIIVIIFYSLSDEQHNDTYINEIKKEREDRDRYMRTAADSPFANIQEDFTGLKYFDPDPAYRIAADLIPVKNKKIVHVQTNDGQSQRYLEYAHAIFKIDGVSNKLLILEVIDMGPARGKLFLAFGDETSARETYGGGRYLDVNKVPGATTITLDFNKAYNPYCAYNATYSCPLPPPENLLKVAIRVGEKSYH